MGASTDGHVDTAPPVVAVIDGVAGNAAAVVNMLRRAGAAPVLTSSEGVLRAASALVLPGVGAFDNAIRGLDRLGLIPVLDDLVRGERRPVLGICLGMQLFCRASAEGQLPGLGWIDGEVRDLRSVAPGLSVPHMCWNYVTTGPEVSLFGGFDVPPRFYFAHSYFVECNDPADLLATTTYGVEFCAAIRRGNVTGVQFHPEKSHRFGLRLLANWVDVVRAPRAG